VRTNKKTGKSAEVRPYRARPSMHNITAIDPGFKFAVANLHRPLRRLAIVQGQLKPAKGQKLPDLAREYIEMAHGVLYKMGISHDNTLGGCTLLVQEYPIPFYRASRESNASVNFMGGAWAAQVWARWIQMFTPGPAKGIPNWNHGGAGKKAAEEFLAKKPPMWVDYDQLALSDVDFEPVEAEEEGKLSDDAASAVGILLAGLQYNGIPMPRAVNTYVAQMT